jgi:ATP-dependent Lon protease
MAFTDAKQNIKEGIDGKPVSWYSDVFNLIFPDLDRDQASKCKICEWKALNEKKGESDAEPNKDE